MLLIAETIKQGHNRIMTALPTKSIQIIIRFLIRATATAISEPRNPLVTKSRKSSKNYEMIQ